MQVRRVLDTIRGRSYEEALMILEYSPYRACELITKTLVSVRLPLALLMPMLFATSISLTNKPAVHTMTCLRGLGAAAKAVQHLSGPAGGRGVMDQSHLNSDR